ncbi:MAG: hypothetical protein R2855_09000 [Thermomicrobiales bacterium]
MHAQGRKVFGRQRFWLEEPGSRGIWRDHDPVFWERESFEKLSTGCVADREDRCGALNSPLDDWLEIRGQWRRSLSFGVQPGKIVDCYVIQLFPAEP